MNHQRFAWRSDAGPPPGTVFFLVLAMVIGGSVLLVQLYPFDFSAGAAPFLGLTYGGAWLALGHVVLFVPLGVVEAVLARRFVERSGPVVLAVVTVDALLLGLICEAGQHWLPTRSSSLIDLCANAMGAVVGYLILTTWFDGGGVERDPSS